jgi:prephenate dehydrogenase
LVILQRKLQDITFGIIGLGLIGGSYAKALKNLKVKNIIGVDSNPIVAMMAKDEGVITENCNDSMEPLKKADVIICALYPAAVLNFVRENVQYFKENMLFTDVMGIKGELLGQVDELLGSEQDFVSGHPMAGREGQGYGQSAAEIFNGANYIIVPRPHNSAEKINWLKDFAYELGCKNVVEVSPKEHDEIIAYTSNLPHAMAIALINSDSMTPNNKYFIAGGFRDATRVADINVALWADLFVSNKKNVIMEIAKLQTQLERWSNALEKGDKEELELMMCSAKAKRKDLFNAKNYR